MRLGLAAALRVAVILLGSSMGAILRSPLVADLRDLALRLALRGSRECRRAELEKRAAK